MGGWEKEGTKLTLLNEAKRSYTIRAIFPAAPRRPNPGPWNLPMLL